MKKFLCLLCFVSLLSPIVAQQNGTGFLFKNRSEGYNMYRIPAIVKTNSGKLLAFCEGRNSLFDHGDIDLVMKSSNDNGRTWSPLRVIWNDGKSTCGNPAPVVDAVTGDVLVAATLNNDKVFILRSKNEGATWELPVEITTQVKPVNWQWYATGPVHAIQMQVPRYKNRLVVPCNHTTTANGNHVSHVIYSDDKGYTWNLGGSVAAEKTDECTVAELTDGLLMLNMRNNARQLPNRKVSKSADGGITWSEPVFDSVLIEPVCQGALLRYSSKPNILLFANPAHTKKRKNLILRVSYDNGLTWPKQITIKKQLSAYNDLVALPDGDVICLFETGKLLPYGGVAFQLVKGANIIP